MPEVSENKATNIGHLPPEIMVKILAHLPTQELLCKVTFVSKYFHQLTKSPEVHLNVTLKPSVRGNGAVRFLRCQFHQHFTGAFFVQNCFSQLLCGYSFALSFFGKRISAQKLLIKCWKIWLQICKMYSSAENLRMQGLPIQVPTRLR